MSVENGVTAVSGGHPAGGDSESVSPFPSPRGQTEARGLVGGVCAQVSQVSEDV